MTGRKPFATKNEEDIGMHLSKHYRDFIEDIGSTEIRKCEEEDIGSTEIRKRRRRRSTILMNV